MQVGEFRQGCLQAIHAGGAKWDAPYPTPPSLAVEPVHTLRYSQDRKFKGQEDENRERLTALTVSCAVELPYAATPENPS